MTIEPDFFEAFESLDEIMAFVLQHVGPDSLEELVSKFIDEGMFNQEQLVDAARKIEDVGLSEGAAIIREAAERAPTKRSQLASLYRHHVITADDMAVHGVDPDTAVFAMGRAIR